MSDRTRRNRDFLRAAVAAIFLAAAGFVGWGVSDRLEADNDFCTACHIAPERPLHAAIRENFDRRPPATLAGAHQLAGGTGAGRTGGDFRCIDCHGGVGLVGRARVKALAAKDAFFYVIGDFEEPDGMRWPLWDEDCRRCHGGFDDREVEAWATPRFHQLPVHNVELGVDCVACHHAHGPGNADAHFLDTPIVRNECARCHSEYEEGAG